MFNVAWIVICLVVFGYVLYAGIPPGWLGVLCGVIIGMSISDLLDKHLVPYFERREEAWKQARGTVARGGIVPSDYWHAVPKKERPEEYRHLPYKWWRVK
ncbi:MAG: hypothetical protein ISN29_12500 [Gammaproteobacteria bacterium AqS3]|nr:hypothetical protein [Gammaproteobacteria bacterium AqS3]